MKLKVTKNLTYPEARKLYDQQQPEFTFAKVVQSLSVKPETKTASTQYNVEDSKITESSTVIVAKRNRNQVLNLLHRQQSLSAQPQAGSQNRTNLSSEQPNAQKQTNRPSTYTRPTNDKHVSNNAVKLHNRFGVFDEADDMGV